MTVHIYKNKIFTNTDDYPDTPVIVSCLEVNGKKLQVPIFVGDKTRVLYTPNPILIIAKDDFVIENNIVRITESIVIDVNKVCATKED